MAQRARRPNGRPRTRQLRLAFTGERHNGRILARVCGRPAWLTCNQFLLLVTLALARGTNDSNGFVADRATAYPVAVHRLRREIDKAAGAGVGSAMVEKGAGLEYRLSPQVSVAIDQTFGPMPGILAAAHANELRRLYEETSP